MCTSDVTIYVDGSCVDKKGGWAVHGEHTGTKSGKMIPPTTNQRAELTALIEGLRMAQAQSHTVVVVYSDSMYSVKGYNEWMHKWVENGWKTASGKPVMNQDLWIQLYSLRGVNVRHVRGHSGVPENELVDKLSRIAATSQ